MDETEDQTCHMCGVTVENNDRMIQHIVEEHNGTRKRTPDSGKTEKNKFLSFDSRYFFKTDLISGNWQYLIPKLFLGVH